LDDAFKHAIQFALTLSPIVARDPDHLNEIHEPIVAA
jgi:hypothetical protein